MVPIVLLLDTMNYVPLAAILFFFYFVDIKTKKLSRNIEYSLRYGI